MGGGGGGGEPDMPNTGFFVQGEQRKSFPPKGNRLHQSFEDPPAPGIGTEAERLAVFRRVRDGLRLWLQDFSAKFKS